MDDAKTHITLYTLIGKFERVKVALLAQFDCENKKLREGVLRQIRAFNCLAGSGFASDGNEARTNGMAWHYAFNWLVGACGGAQWDEVRTDT